MPSQLVFLLAFMGREDSDLARQCAATVIDQQRLDGGWSVAPGAPSDISASVQAYFALKLTGYDPSDEPLSRARQRIRELGGADVADTFTRFFLALFRQIDYDLCEALPPEIVSIGGRDQPWRAPLSLVWSHRPVRAIGIDRGVRELFVNKPRDWLAVVECKRIAALGRTYRRFFRYACRFADRRGWTPLRRRAQARCESQLIRQIEPSRISELGFCEFVWHTIALLTIGYSADSAELRRCDARLREMVDVDEDSDRALPRLRDTRPSDTALVFRSLTGSGLSPAHPTIETSIGRSGRWHESNANLLTIDLCNLVKSLGHMETAAFEYERGLPPDLEICRDWQFPMGESDQIAEGLPEEVERAAGWALEQFRTHQNPDGGWPSMLCSRRRLSSEPGISGSVLEALHAHEPEGIETASNRAVEYLRAAQRADGSWANSVGGERILCTSQAIRGLLAAGENAGEDVIAAAVNWLVVEQQSNGGWCEKPYEHQPVAGESDDPGALLRDRNGASQTAWVILALVAAGYAHCSAARRGIEFLLDLQEDDGGWLDRQLVLRDPVSNRWFRSDLHSVAYALMALSGWAVATNSAHSAAADKMSLRLVGASPEF